MVNFRRHYNLDEEEIVSERILKAFKVPDPGVINFEVDGIKVEEVMTDSFLLEVKIFTVIDKETAMNILNAVPLTKEEQDGTEAHGS